MDVPENFRAGYVALIGKPNVGKSTLLNQLLQFKLSIVTKKPQTTRKKVLGILSQKNSQIIFIDTPGLIEPKYNLQHVMMKYLDTAIRDADMVVYLTDVSGARRDIDEIKNKFVSIQKPVILVLNKIDLIDKRELLPLIELYQKIFDFDKYVPISALKNDGLDILIDEIVSRLPESPPYYPPEYVTDEQERFFVTEIIREKIFELYGQEIPYSCHVQIETFKENPGGKDYIQAVIFVDQMSQKGILIGKKGQALKKVGQSARREIEQFLERPVFLELYVKVMEGWRKKKGALKSLGF